MHGISLSPASWTGFEAEFRNNRGFKTFAVDHAGGAYTSGAPTWGGNGDVHDSYAFVRGGMAGSVGVAEAPPQAAAIARAKIRGNQMIRLDTRSFLKAKIIPPRFLISRVFDSFRHKLNLDEFSLNYARKTVSG